MYYIYFAKSLKNGKVYIGLTNKNPEVRVKEHNQNSNTWSKHNKPLRLIYYESFVCKEDAIQREKFFKTGIGKKVKKAIISVMDP